MAPNARITPMFSVRAALTDLWCPSRPQRTRLEGIAERKLRRRQLTGDGNVEINGRDLR